MKSLLLLVLFFTSLSSWSQTFYGSISGGYQFGVGKQDMEHHSVSEFIDPNTPWPWEKVDLSLGQGVLTNGIIGYDLNQSYGLTLSGSYLFGAEFSSKTSNNLTVERKLSASMVRINPSFRMYVSQNKFRTYADIGFILGIGKIKFNLKNSSVDATILEYSYVYDGGLSYGASARFGMEYQVSKRLRFFGEFQFISQAYAPTKGYLTKYIVNNEDVTESFQQNASANVVFVDAIQSDPSVSPSPNEPQIRARHSYPFHSFGLNVGVKYILWEKDKEGTTAN
ncbi:MAG: hypothetical protein RL207_1335 [Bacteroidota bacterium]|jgi:hypothetical protein